MRIVRGVRLVMLRLCFTISLHLELVGGPIIGSWSVHNLPISKVTVSGACFSVRCLAAAINVLRASAALRRLLPHPLLLGLIVAGRRIASIPRRILRSVDEEIVEAKSYGYHHCGQDDLLFRL